MGLIKTGLKAAVAVKVAHVVHDRIERRQQAQWATGGHPAEMPASAGAPQAAAPVAHVAPVVPTEPPPVSDVLAQLTQLGELKAAGVLTEAEFQTQKARILNG
jgi:Short C-terminal domain